MLNDIYTIPRALAKRAAALLTSIYGGCTVHGMSANASMLGYWRNPNNVVEKEPVVEIHCYRACGMDIHPRYPTRFDVAQALGLHLGEDAIMLRTESVDALFVDCSDKQGES